MKQKILLTEEELVEIIDLLVESQDLSQYDEEDFIDVFLEVFKPWIKNKLGDSWKLSPISRLINNYYDEFGRELKVETESYGWMNLARKMGRTGRDIVSKGLYSLPSLQPKEFFTKKYEKILSFLIKNMDLPSYVQISFDEEQPYDVHMNINANWIDMITSDKSLTIVRPHTIYDKIVKTLREYIGLETTGKPIYGELNLGLNSTKIDGVDEWVKEILNKNIKKELRQSDVGKDIHSISFKTEGRSFKGEFKIRMKGHAGWNSRSRAKAKLNEILESRGYNLKFFDIET